MGVVESIDYVRFPRQSSLVGKRVGVCFKYDTLREIGGCVVRCDHDEPFEMIIRLDDDRYVRAVECQYTVREPNP